MSSTKITVDLDPSVIRRVISLLTVCIVALAVLNVVSLAITHGLGKPELGRDLLDLNRESSLGSWLAGMLFAVLAVVALLCGVQDSRAGGSWRRNWRLLSAAFLYVSVDELLGLHERVSPAVQSALGTSGAFLYAWTIPALVLLVLFGLVQLKFILSLDAQTRSRLILAGAVFVGAAVGLEMIESAIVDPSAAEQTLLYNAFTAIEEVLEMTAVVMVLSALLHHLVRGPVDLVLSHPAGQRRGA